MTMASQKPLTDRKPGIVWKYAHYYPHSPAMPFRLPDPLNSTDCVTLDHPELSPCILKREDTLPTGSHKERAACYQVSRRFEEGNLGCLISSSGNAAIAVAEYARKANLPAFVFFSRSVQNSKLLAAAEREAHIFLSNKPINYARYASRIFNLPNLRPSIDPDAASGFMSLGFEIHDQFMTSAPAAVFMFTTSGATLLGISAAFDLIDSSHSIWKTKPALHAAQSGKAQDLAAHFDARGTVNPKDAVAGIGGLSGSALVPELLGRISLSGGSAWALTSAETESAMQILQNAGIKSSPESAAALAACRRWRQHGGQGTALVILSGRAYSKLKTPVTSAYIHTPESYRDLRQVISGIMSHD
ncbi:PLP-dependent lyase/thiolase [bacterium]|nr:PLP-dependent lyase/thiolase [candidate division CSSED10-310 bacterium]